MRKTFILGFGLATILLSTSCEKDDKLNQGVMGEGIVFSSSISSRATDTSFEANDQIGISMNPGNITNILYSTEDGINFTSANSITYGMAGDVETVDFTAVYPYKESSISNDVYSFTLSTEADTPLTENDVMYATAPGTAVGSKKVSLNFKHKLVKVVIQLSDADGQAITGAQLKINNQQLAGSLNLSDGTVTSNDTPDDNMPFAANASTSGQYQTIVMPSTPVQGRYIEITHNGKTYTIPVDNQEFVSGKKLSFAATLNANGTVDPGKPITVVPSVSEWVEEKIESGWILTGEISVVDKSPKQLASNIELSSEAAVINNFTGTLNEDDIYCISYTRADGSTSSTDIAAANITIAPAAGGTGKAYTLPAGQAEGKLLIKVAENTSGISITTTDSGITLSEVIVYTSSKNVVIPITLWEGEGISNSPYNNIGIANFEIKEADRSELKLGAKLRIYFTPVTDGGTNIYFSTYSNENYGDLGALIYDGYNYTEEYNNEYVTVLVLDQLIKDIEENNYVVSLKGANCKVTKIVLVPASGDEEVDKNLLWQGTGLPLNNEWAVIGVWLPKNFDITAGSKIRVHFNGAQDGATLSGALVSYNESTNHNDYTPILPEHTISSNDTYVDFPIDETVLQKMKEQVIGINKINWYDKNYKGLVVTSVEYIPASSAQE